MPYVTGSSAVVESEDAVPIMATRVWLKENFDCMKVMGQNFFLAIKCFGLNTECFLMHVCAGVFNDCCTIKRLLRVLLDLLGQKCPSAKLTESICDRCLSHFICDGCFLLNPPQLNQGLTAFYEIQIFGDFL